MWGFFKFLTKSILKIFVCNCEVDENTEALVMLCVPEGSVPSPKIQGFLDTQVCIILDQSCCLRSNQVIHYKLIKTIK